MLISLIFCLIIPIFISATQDSKRLFDDLMLNYINYRRPVERPSQQADVHVRLSLSQIIDLVCFFTLF